MTKIFRIEQHERRDLLDLFNLLFPQLYHLDFSSHLCVIFHSEASNIFLLFLSFFLVVSTSFDPYHHEHDELMGYEFDDDGSLKEKTSSHNHNNDNVINHPDVIDDTTNHLESTIVGPYFDYTVFKNITVLVGETAQLRCRVKNIGNKTVSWVRHRDIHLLTVGKVAYTSDSRFQTIHDIDAEEWILRVSVER